MANTKDVNTIIIITKHGHIPKLVAKYRPKAAIYAVSNSRNVLKKLTITRGVFCCFIEDLQNENAVFKKVREQIYTFKLFKPSKNFVLINRYKKD